MSEQNDTKIIALRTQIAEKRGELGKTERFSPVTHCSLGLDGITYNLHAQDQEGLRWLEVKLFAYYTAALATGNEGLLVSGSPLGAWLSDVRGKLVILDHRNAKAKLDALEKQLGTLLSEDKRTELALEEIAKSLA